MGTHANVLDLLLFLSLSRKYELDAGSLNKTESGHRGVNGTAEVGLLLGQMTQVSDLFS